MAVKFLFSIAAKVYSENLDFSIIPDKPRQAERILAQSCLYTWLAFSLLLWSINKRFLLKKTTYSFYISLKNSYFLLLQYLNYVSMWLKKSFGADSIHLYFQMQSW